jgi:ASCH domain
MVSVMPSAVSGLTIRALQLFKPDPTAFLWGLPSPAITQPFYPQTPAKPCKTAAFDRLPAPAHMPPLNPMKCLSVRQPYASLIMAGTKRREYRSWRPPDWLIGQRFAVHASLTLHELVDAGAHALPRGYVLGSVRLVGVRRYGDGWAWLLAEPREFVRPMRASGMLGLWEFSR